MSSLVSLQVFIYIHIIIYIQYLINMFFYGASGPFGANIALAVRARVIGLRDMGAC